MFQRLTWRRALSAAELLAEADLAARAPEERPYVFFNFVTTLDGRAAMDGIDAAARRRPPTSRCCSSLRAVADAVLIGPGTVRAEGYGRLVGARAPRRRRRPRC